MATPIGSVTSGMAGAAGAGKASPLTGNPFADMLEKAVDALEGVSAREAYANQLIDQYVAGKVELADVMIAQAEANLAIQLAVTTITTAVNTFKEITQMPV